MSAPAVAALLPRDWPYQNQRCVVLPYSDKHPDIYPETFFASMYFRLKEEKTLDIIFPGMGINTLDAFVGYIGSPRRLGRLVPCVRNPDGPPIPAGLGWMCESECGRASFGFGYYREYWGNKVHAELSTMMLAYWFREMKSEVLYGTTVNPLALRYSKRFGFRPLCVLPKFFFKDGELRDAHLIVLEKQVFQSYYLNWLKAQL